MDTSNRWVYRPATKTQVESWTLYICADSGERIVIWKPPYDFMPFRYCHTANGRIVAIEEVDLDTHDPDQARHMAEVKYYGALVA